MPLVVRGAGTGYTGGAVPVRGGVVLSLERLNRILEIDEENLLAVVEPNVITGRPAAGRRARRALLSAGPGQPAPVGRSAATSPSAPAVRAPSSTARPSATCSGSRRCCPTGEIVRTGSKAVKNVVGYDLTQLLVGSEGTLAIITKIILRLVPKPPVQITLRASFADVRGAVRAVTELIRRRVVPATLELIDSESLAAVTRYLGTGLAPPGTGAVLLLEVDGLASGVAEEADRVDRGVPRRPARRSCCAPKTQPARDELWRIRRELSHSLRTIAGLKINHDVVVPRGRVPQLFDLVARLRERATP